MKGRDSGMPDEEYWESFYNARAIVERLIPREVDSVLEFGTGYGTFTLPTISWISGKFIGCDIEPGLVMRLQEKLSSNSLHGTIDQRDFMEDGSGLVDESVEHCMLYNILHIENVDTLLLEALRVLKVFGTVSIIHWRSDIETPRGPDLSIRPTPEQCITMAERVGFRNGRMLDISDVAPYHFGIVMEKTGLST